jgi:ATP-dependent DNA helicase RecG
LRAAAPNVTFMAAVDAHFRRQLALDAIEKVKNGALPRTLEDELLDFKEEKGTFDPKTKRRTPIPPTHDPAAHALAGETACMANGLAGGGGILVVGVDDKVAGPDAFVGTYLDVEWLRDRIYALTQPKYSIEPIETIYVGEARLYLISVPPAIEEVRVDGKLRARRGDNCLELDGNAAREFLEKRRRFDWSSEPSGFPLSTADPAALASARRKYEDEQGTAPKSNRELARRLGVLVDEAANDPELTRAGALLLCPYEQDGEKLDVIVTTAESAPSSERLLLKAPLLPAFDVAWETVEKHFQMPPIVLGEQRIRPYRVPARAAREAMINALMHRDYRLTPPVTVSVIGSPASQLKVVSPGEFPSGVSEERLISSPSRPRNPALANALRALGLAEREGVGVDEMFTQMLRDGQRKPSIRAEGGDVVVRLRGGDPNFTVRSFYNSLYEEEPALQYDVGAHLAISHLLERPSLRIGELAEMLGHSVEEEALLSLEQLTELGAVELLVKRGRTYRLSADARTQLQGSIRHEQRRSLDEHAEVIRAALDTMETIGREEAATLLGLGVIQASRILSKLAVETTWLRPVGSGKGRGNRYKLAE